VRYDVNIGSVELSVAELCALAHPSGNLEHGSPRHRAEVRMRGDVRRHRLPAEANRTTDVYLRYTCSHRDIFYTIEGHADAVIEEGKDELTVELCRTTRAGDLGSAAQADVYSQLRCYAHFLAEERHLKRVRLRVRLINGGSGEVKDLYSAASADELYAFFLSLLERVDPIARDLVDRCEERIPSAKKIGFPYEHPREGQTEMAERTFRAIRRGQRMFAEAPTGIGKTMSALYPSVKAMGEGLCDRIFYLTAKSATGREAFAAAGKLFASGARLRTVTLRAKAQMCLREGGCRSGGASCCNGRACPYAKGYYTRSGEAINALLAAKHGFTPSLIREAGNQYRVCPYELSLDLSERCEIIICDYNYVFDPAVYLRRYFDAAEGERGSYVFLVDEAHNLPDRARDMYSMRLPVLPFEEVYARVEPDADPELEATLGGFVIAMRRLARLCTENRQKNEDGTENGYYLNRQPLMNFGETVNTTAQNLEQLLKKLPEHVLREPLSELLSLLRRYQSLSECYDDRFLTYVELVEGKVTVQIFCLDPAGVLDVAMSRARATILFSATLAPLDYFSDILGGGHGAEQIILPSPYDPSRLCVTVASSVSTRMEERDGSYRKVATLIAAAISGKAGNYLVYFPSYDYMEKVLRCFCEKYPKVPHIVQKRQMHPRDREAFLQYFENDEGHMRVGFCVLGGSFSEGVDLPGSRLIGAIVVGVGIPGLSNERNILRDYYENKCERGYDYAYTYPGMNRVLQAAGRVIRTEEDRGIVVLIDSRYAEEPYLHLYPQHWEGVMAAATPAALAHRVQEFWREDAKMQEKND